MNDHHAHAAPVLVMRAEDIPWDCAPRTSCIGEITVARAVEERLVAEETVLTNNGFIEGTQYGFGRDGALVAQHGVLVFADSTAAANAWGEMLPFNSDRWRASALPGIGDDALLLEGEVTRQLLWRNGPVVSVLMMCGADRNDLEPIAWTLDQRIKHGSDSPRALEPATSQG